MSYVQSGQAAVTATSATITLTSVAAGHSILAAARISNGSDVLTGISSSINGALTVVGNTQNLSGSVRTYTYKLENASAGTHILTFSFSSSQSARCLAAEYSESTVDAVGTQATVAATTTPISPSAVSTVSGDTIVSIISVDTTGTIAPGGSQSARQTVNSGLQIQDQGVGAAGSYSGSWLLGTSSASVAVALAMKAAVVVTAPVPSGAKQTFVTTTIIQY